MRTTWIVAVLVLFAELHASDSKSSTHSIFMSNYCSDVTEVHNSLVVLLLPQTSLKAYRKLDFIQCSLDLLAPKGHGLYAHFLHVSISPDQKHSDRLHLYQVDAKNERHLMTPGGGLYGMLDRSILSSDYDGAKIEDYLTWERRMRLDYLGKPTAMHSGFRVLITVVSKNRTVSECPALTSKCTGHPFCIPSALVCDGYPNCGHQDLSDEKGCDPDHLVTDLLDRYSLLYDILVVTCVPALVFLIFAVLILCLSWRYMKRKYPLKDPPAVSYSANTEGGRVELYDDSYDPPSYSEVVGMRLNRPPAYSSLDAMEKAGTVIIESDDDQQHGHAPRGSPGHIYHGHHRNHHHHHHPHPQRYNRGRLHPDMKGDSNSSLDSPAHSPAHSPGPYRAHPGVLAASRRPMMAHYDSSDDEETKHKHKRKGGKCKSKGKRRADDLLCPDESADNRATTTRTPTSAAETDIPLTSAPSASKIYSPSVPYANVACPPLSGASSSSSVPLSSPSPPPPHPFPLEQIKSSASNESEGFDPRKVPSDGINKKSSSSHDTVAVLPVYNNGVDKKVKDRSEEFPVHSDSSGVEADRKSETESESWNPSKNDSKTESCASLNEHNRNSPALMNGKSKPVEGIRVNGNSKSGSRDDIAYNGVDNEGDDGKKALNRMGTNGDVKWGKSLEDDDNEDGDGDGRIIKDVYQGGDLSCDSVEIDLRSGRALTVKSRGNSVV